SACDPPPVTRSTPRHRGRPFAASRPRHGDLFAVDGNAELRRLAEEGGRVDVDRLPDERFGMATTAHREREMRYRGRYAGTPVAGRGDTDPLRSVHLENVHGALRRDLRLGIEGQTRPEAVVQDHPDGVRLGIIDHPSPG